MNLLLPVRRLIARDPLNFADWLDGLQVTQEEVDSELLFSASTAEASESRLASVAWVNEDAHS